MSVCSPLSDANSRHATTRRDGRRPGSANAHRLVSQCARGHRSRADAGRGLVSACFMGAMALAGQKPNVALPPDSAVEAEIDLVVNGGAYSLRIEQQKAAPVLKTVPHAEDVTERTYGDLTPAEPVALKFLPQRMIGVHTP